MKSKIALIAILSVSLAACGPAPQPLPQQMPDLNDVAQQPVPQVQQADDGIGVGTVAAAAIGGAVLGNMMGKSSSQPQRTVIIDNRRPNYGYNYNRGYGKKVTTTTTVVKKSLFGNKTITKTVTKTKRRR